MRKSVVLISGLFILIALVLLFLFPVQAYDLATTLSNKIAMNVGIFYILIAVASLLFVITISCKYGYFVLGKGEKEYSELSWAAMMFCTGIGGSMMVFAFVEPLFYLNDPPFGIVPMSNESFEYAHMYGQFHWGILDWVLCVPLTLFVSYLMYATSDESRITIGTMLISPKNKKRIVAEIIDVFLVFVIISGAATSMGLSAPVICKIISVLFGVPNDEGVLAVIFVLWFSIYAASVWCGVEKGIKKLSRLNIYIALFFIICIFFIAGPLKVINAETNSLGLLLNSFPRMALYSAPFADGGFPQRWTVFYWALTLAYTPAVAIFTARISKGRTIKQLVFGMIIYGSLGTMFSFATLGFYSLHLQNEGIINVAEILSQRGNEEAIVAILDTLPMHQLFEIIFAVVCMIFMATTIDSSVYVIASMTSKEGIRMNHAPSRKYRMIWAITMLLFSGALAKMGGLETMQVFCVISAFPMVIIVLGTIIRMSKNLKTKDGI